MADEEGSQNTAFQQRFFVLDHELLVMRYYNKEADADDHPEKPCGRINLRDVTQMSIPTSPDGHASDGTYRIELETPTRKWVLATTSEEEAARWREVLARVLDQGGQAEDHGKSNNNNPPVASPGRRRKSMSEEIPSPAMDKFAEEGQPSGSRTKRKNAGRERRWSHSNAPKFCEPVSGRVEAYADKSVSIDVRVGRRFAFKDEGRCKKAPCPGGNLQYSAARVCKQDAARRR